MKTTSIKLDNETWDIGLNNKGCIETIDNPDSIAQNVACAVLTYLGESYANPDIGVDYTNLEDGKKFQYLSFLYMNEAKRVNNVQDAKALLYQTKSERASRKINGILTILDSDNNTTRLTL